MREIKFINDGLDKKLNFAPAKEIEKMTELHKKKL